MALEINDLMALQSMDKSSMTPYEQYKVGYMQQKNHTSGLGIAGLTVGVGAAVLAIGGAAWAGSRAQNAKDVAIAKNDGLRGASHPHEEFRQQEGHYGNGDNK